MVPADPSTDPHIDPKVRAFLTELNKDSSPFWELPHAGSCRPHLLSPPIAKKKDHSSK
jgi:hypothetical protein